MKACVIVKFNDGYWLLRPGVTARYATETMDVRRGDDSVSAVALTRRWEHRGSHLNTPTITVDLSSPREDVVTVRATRWQPTEPALPAFEVADRAPAVSTREDDGVVELSSGRLAARLTTRDAWGLEFVDAARGRLTGAAGKSLASMTVDGDDHMVQRLELPVGASVYGLGERFTPFVKNGQVVEIWNEDGGTASEQAYKSVPFLITDAGFGIFVNNPARVSFEIASEVVSSIQFSTRGQELEYLVIAGETPLDILRAYTDLTGRPALPPPWSFGLWLTTSFTTDYDEATANEFIDGMLDRGIDLSVFHLDCYWMKPLNWCDFTWDDDSFPDPEGMLARFAERGLHTSVWINPYLGQRSPLFQEAADAGYLVRRADGTVWQWDMWVAGMGLIDFTNPDARRWYGERVEALVRQGVHAVKADFGERIPTDVVWHDGSDPERMHNYYSELYTRTVFEAVERARGVGEAVLFSRSATAGGQKYPVHWGGDCESTYVSMAESLRGGLSLSASGFGFWSHDIGGFEGVPSPALFKRWLAFGLFSSHSRLHGSESYRVPWAFDEESVEVCRDLLRVRHTLLPYLWNAAVEAHETGAPLMRPMFLAFPGDRTCAPLDRQYMLGPDVLVAPVFTDEGDVEFYLPEGSWVGLLDGRPLEGGRWHRERHGFESLPVFVRAGAVLPRGSRDDSADYDHTVAPVFEAVALADGAAARGVLHDRSGAVAVTVEVRREGDELVATVLEGLDRLSAGFSVRWLDGVGGRDGAALGTAEAGVGQLRVSRGR